MNRTRGILVPGIVLCSCISALAINAPAASATSSPGLQAESRATGGPQATTGYRIGPDDLLEITVVGIDELESTVRVSENGTINLSLIGEVRVAGMTRSEAAAEIESALSRYVREPEVIIDVQEFQSQQYTVMGAVSSPGTYKIEGTPRILEVLSTAGGINPEEAEGTISIIREGLDGVPIVIDASDLVDRGDMAFNIRVEADDVINVSRKPRYSIYMHGQIASPGDYELREPITLLRAIAMAGGLADRAAAKRIKILRTGPDGRQQIIECNLKDIENGKTPDVQIRGGDVIVVPETVF